MQSIIIGVTFFLGVVVVIVAIVALFKKITGGKGSLKLPGGIEISGTGASIVFLLVGAVLVLSSFGWAATQKEVVAKEKQVVEKDQTIASERKEKNEILRETATVHESLKKQVQVNDELKRRIPASVLEEMRRTNPELLKAAATEISPALKTRLATVDHH
ncbi:MAG: hypothetical protein HYR85_18335 [Planctomycetes bacterium]|nr:hypothetical protein [Planctomycetota bacterium]MBI3847844.1 hypothetical protein [Planctomycetota bacterium]